MAYSFVNSSDEKFQKISDTEFFANQSLLSRVKLSENLPTAIVYPKRIAVVTATDKLRLDKLRWSDVHPVTIEKGQKLIVDLGSLYVGHFQVDIGASGSPMDSPLLLHTRFAEQLAELSEISANVESWLPLSWIQEERRHIDMLPTTSIFERRYSCRYIMLEAVGQSRKWQPQFTNPTFQAESAVLLRHVDTSNGWPKWLQVVDQKCLLTLRNTMQHVFEDGTKRDQRLWLLDFRIQAKVNYVTYREIDIARSCLYLFSAFSDDIGRMPADIFTKGQTPIADDLFWFDYQLQFLMACEEYMSATHDQKTLRDIYPIVKRTFAFIQKELTPQLIVGPRQDIFVDWSVNCDKEAAVQAQVVLATRSFIHLASLMGDATTSERQYLQRLQQQTITYYYDPEALLFVSGSDHEVNLLSQIHMLLADVLPLSEALQVVAQVKKRFDLKSELTTPSTKGLLVEMLFKYGESQLALDLLRAYWYGMVKHGADAFWEVFDPNDLSYSPYGSILLNSYNFGWSAYPAYLIRRYL